MSSGDNTSPYENVIVPIKIGKKRQGKLGIN